MKSKIVFAISGLLFSTSLMAELSRSDCNKLWEGILEKGTLEPLYQSLQNTCDEAFRKELKNIMSTNIDLGYSKARQIFFSTLDNVDGNVCDVYIGKCIKTSGIPDGNVMNCEHSWPQSLGAVGIAKSDIHHLYPVDSKVNSRRSNYPFCEVEKYSYSEAGSFFGASKSGTKCFEPRDEHKGDLARSMVYFAVRYGKTIDSEQEEFFRAWSNLDPVSEKEESRNDGIEQYQKNRNPFIDHPEFIELISDF